MLKFFDLELPVEEMYAPPITIRCVDCRSFGRYTLVGTHQITSIHKYLHRTAPKDDTTTSKTYTTIGGQIVLAAPIKSDDEAVDGRMQTAVSSRNGGGNDGSATPGKNSSCENLTMYGAVCVGKA